MTPVDWLTWALSVILAIFGTWAISSRHTKRVEKELQDTKTKLDTLLDTSRQTQRDVTRIEQGEVLKAQGSESLRPTIELAIRSALMVIIREVGHDASVDEIESHLEQALPKLAAQWRSVSPDAADRLKVIDGILKDWKDTIKSRFWGSHDFTHSGGVQLGPSLFIPANVVMKVQNMDPLSFEARVAERPWYQGIRSVLIAATVAVAILELFLWSYVPPGLLPAAVFGWFVLLLGTGTFYSFGYALRGEKLRRPDWSVLFPPGAIQEEPCHVDFGLESRTLIAPLPLSAWVPGRDVRSDRTEG